MEFKTPIRFLERPEIRSKNWLDDSWGNTDFKKVSYALNLMISIRSHLTDPSLCDPDLLVVMMYDLTTLLNEIMPCIAEIATHGNAGYDWMRTRQLLDDEPEKIKSGAADVFAHFQSRAENHNA
ncbi:hypothetical protein QUV50_06995 [Phascolarctobacterium faecium]|nr:hypothetical protein [Phascolarctobacterium faecium]MDM8111528.1 hypothetical protein [Phascolarctobacterium faecium]